MKSSAASFVSLSSSAAYTTSPSWKILAPPKAIPTAATLLTIFFLFIFLLSFSSLCKITYGCKVSGGRAGLASKHLSPHSFASRRFQRFANEISSRADVAGSALSPHSFASRRFQRFANLISGQADIAPIRALVPMALRPTVSDSLPKVSARLIPCKPSD